MSSNLGCVGLQVDDEAALSELLTEIEPQVSLLGSRGGVEVMRWQDASGARLLLGVAGGEILDLLPSFAGRPGAILAEVTLVNDEVALASVVDDEGTQLTALAVELEQRLLLAPDTPLGGPASVIALGVDVSVHADAAAFAASDASILGPDVDPDSAPPQEYLDKGWPWPPRMAEEAFFSHGVFGPPQDAEAFATLSGTVLESARHTVALTGQEFVVARVRTVGFEVDVCLAATDHPELPAPGQVVAGTMFLVACLHDLP